MKRTPSYYKEREVGPRIAEPGTYDDYYARRFKDLYEEYKFAMNDMKQQFMCEQDRLRMECAKIKYDEETEHLKMIIREREKERKRLDNLRAQKVFKQSRACKKPKDYSSDESESEVVSVFFKVTYL